MRRFGLIGYPLCHSFSKKYFTEKFETENISGCIYENYPLVAVEELPALLKSVPDLEGLNVTIPYKSSIIKYLDTIDPEASATGAVNVLRIKRSGDQTRISGFNSDITGIRDSILPVLKEIKQALVLGTGGSSGSVRHVLERSGVRVIRVSRKERPDSLIYSDITPELMSSTDLIVNTTPLGMYPDTGTKPDIRYDLLEKRHILFDLVYNPEFTLFLQEGQRRGCTIITGLKMLYSQAEKSWEIWNDDSY